ncbi:hypothetical protein ID850_15910 [Xenorhabdus sp. Flor]|uniref:hypothetical protein n=1 Tax=Xenorhabdus cabanillasii TaxID=351673 RepID=UPI0019AFB793|nr:hypothetical protein [Xenorhabdus sp. Flor]MBD2816195.1 hypothetical protein [Xenorhabdus sp. Flor]
MRTRVCREPDAVVLQVRFWGGAWPGGWAGYSPVCPGLISAPPVADDLPIIGHNINSL